MANTKDKVDMSFVTALYDEFINEVNLVTEVRILKKSELIVKIAKAWDRKLRDYISLRHFENDENEIEFFKKIKPKFYSHFYYNSELYNIEVRKPIGSYDFIRKYYEGALDRISFDFSDNADFYQYLRSDATHLDKQYFVRGNQFTIRPISAYEDSEIGYSTGYDYKVTMFLVNDKLASYLNNKIAATGAPDQKRNFLSLPKIPWTDSKTALIELIYAFKARGSFNSGKATLKELTDYFQLMFDIELNNPSRDFQEILRRKNGYTIYLDGLKESYLRYIDNIENRDRRG